MHFLALPSRSRFLIYHPLPRIVEAHLLMLLKVWTILIDVWRLLGILISRSEMRGSCLIETTITAAVRHHTKRGTITSSWDSLEKPWRVRSLLLLLVLLIIMIQGSTPLKMLKLLILLILCGGLEMGHLMIKIILLRYLLDVLNAAPGKRLESRLENRRLENLLGQLCLL